MSDVDQRASLRGELERVQALGPGIDGKGTFLDESVRLDTIKAAR